MSAQVQSASDAVVRVPAQRALASRWLESWPYFAGFASLFVGWHVVASYLFVSVLFPPPAPVLAKAGELIMSGELPANIWASLQRILAGFALGCIIGTFVGLLVGSFALMRKFLDPIVETLRFIPAVAMITVSVIWFGIGEFSKVFIILYGTVFIVVISTAAGVAGIAKNKRRAAQSLGATPLQLFFFVTLPAAMPSILTGMRLAMANAFTTTWRPSSSRRTRESGQCCGRAGSTCRWTPSS